MADDPDFSTEATPTLQQLATFLVDELTDVQRLARLETAMANAHQKGASVATGAQIQAVGEVKKAIGDTATTVENLARGSTGWLLSHVVAHMLGIEVPAEALRGAFSGGDQSVVGRALGDTVMSALKGSEDGELQPGDAGAIRLIGMISQLTITGWFEGILAEEAASLWIFPKVEAISQLAKELIDALGLGRLMRVALRPLVQTAIATPLQWKVNKQLRPNLLSEGEILKAFARGDYTGADAAEELARLGYSDRRQDLLIKSAAKRLSLDDALALARHDAVDSEYPFQNLRDEGFDETTARLAVAAAVTKRLDAIHDDALAAVRKAFAERELTQGAFDSYLASILFDEAERAEHSIVATTLRNLNVKHLSHGEIVDCVELAVLPFAAYRAWLEREGYPDDEATALEIRLQMKIAKDLKAEDARRLVEEQRAKEKQLAEAAKAARLKTIEEQRALQRRGSIADLTRAVVRGLIPLDRLVDVLRQEYDADTVQILADTALQLRADFVAQQKAAEAARQRAAQRSIDVGALESAVLENVLTVDQFRQALAARNFVGADVDVLAATLAARKKDLDAARAKRAAADARAQHQQIDLGRAEQLVIRGHGTLAQYDALLQTLDFDAPSRAAMVDLLQLKVNDYATAQKERADAEQRLKHKGVSVDAMHRAVVLKLRTSQDYQALLVTNGFTADAVALLVAEADADAAEAEAARQRRREADARAGAPGLSLDRIARAARLGVITPAAYRDRLVRAKFTADDIAIDLDLLVVEIADEKARQAKRDALEQQAADRGLSLQQLAAAVKAGAATIEDYRARAAALTYAPADVDLLVAVLQDELDTQADADARRTTIDGELAARQLSLGELEDAVGANLKNLAQYQQQLEQWGYASSDAQLLASLLATKLAAQRAKGGPGG